MFREQLKILRKQKNITQEELASVIGVERSTVGKWEGKDRIIPSPEILDKLATYFDVSVDELLGRETSPPQLDNIFPIKKKKFPLLGEIACGKPIYADEDRESYIESGTDIEADFCLKAKGDSMINARILNGDIVFIRTQPMVENGEIAAVIIDNEATLKRVYYYPDSKKLILNPENPAFEPLVYIDDELDQVRILGKAVAFQSDVK